MYSSFIDERDRVQKKTFTKWVNKHLIKMRKHINDLYEDLRDGHNLISLLEVLSGVTLPREKGRMRFHRLQNVQIALDFLKQRQVKLVNIRNDDITDGNPKLTLGLIWTIILHFQVMMQHLVGSGEGAKKVVLNVYFCVVQGRTNIWCSNFTKTLLNVLYRPDLIDMEKVAVQSNYENLEQAFAVAEQLGVTRLLDPEDVDVPSPDEKSVITYVSSIYDAFPKIPEGGEGISANEVDSKWQEYQNKVIYLFQWIRQHITMMSDKTFPHNPVELKALYNEYVHFKETEIPAKEAEKSQIQHLYKLFEVWMEFGRIKLPQGYHPNDVEEEWGKLIVEMLEREKALRPAVERLELLLQIANKIQNGALNCEEKLTLARNTLQADAAHLDSDQQVQYEADVAMYLQECEGLIRQLQIDVKILRDEKYYQVEQIIMRVIKLQDELVALRLECTNLYRKGHFISSTEQTGLRPLNLTVNDLTTDVGSGTLHTTSLTWFKKPMTRSELVAISSTQDEGNLRFVYELLAWVEEVQVRLERAEWGSDLPSVEAQLDIHKMIHTAVEELESGLKEAKHYESQVSPNFKTSYSDTLNKLGIQYIKLLETSRLRMQHLTSLHSFVSKATTELIWLNEKEEEELAYDWSDRNTNISAKKEYFVELMKELEQKQKVIKSHQETGEQLSLENHPARQTVEAYSAALQTQWHWIKQLCCCVEQHLKENTSYFQFLSDVKEADLYLRNLQETIKRKYKCDRTSGLSKLEDLLQDSMDEKEQLIQYKSSIASLVGRAKTIVQLIPRNPDNALKTTIPIKAICDYRQIEITVCKNDECVLEDNSHRTKWKVISPTGNEAMVPSVCFIIPAPNQEAIDMGARVEQMYQNVMALWHQLHVNMKSVVSWNYLVKDIEIVCSWNKENVRTPSEQQQVMKKLHMHYADFLVDSQESQVFSIADRLRLEEEVDNCKERCEQLLVATEAEAKDETLSKTYISDLQNVTLRLEKCEDRLIRRLQAPLEGDPVQDSALRIAEQEETQKELDELKSNLNELTKKCEGFFYQSPSAASVPMLRSEMDVVIEKMSQVSALSSSYTEKLKTVDVVLKNSQSAETLVKMYEMKLSEEDLIPADQKAIEAHRNILQQWCEEVEGNRGVFSSLEKDIQQANAACEHLGHLHHDRSLDLERYREKVEQLKDRWRHVCSQIETRQSELESIQEVLEDYRGCHQSLIQWIEETTLQQEKMEPGKAEDRKILSEQLSQETALVAEIEKNQAKLDECQDLSKQYSSSVKDYELQLMTYRACVESHQKSAIKRWRIHSSSDVITQEFMDLRTRYTALVTLTTQHVKYISDALRRLEEEEKVIEEEKHERVGKMKELLGWVLNTGQVLQKQNLPTEGADLGAIERSFSEQQVLTEELNAKQDQVAETIKTTQIFLAKHGNRMSEEEREQVTSQLNDLKETYNQLCDQSAEQVQQIQNQLTQEVQRKDNETIAGVIDLGTVEIFPIFHAMQRGLIDQDTGLALLQIQVTVCGLTIPETNERLSVEEAFQKGAIDDRTYRPLQELETALKVIERTSFANTQLLPTAAAIDEKVIEENVGLKILEAQLSSGGLSIPSTGEAISLEKAFQQGLINAPLHSKLLARTKMQKDLIDPNTAEKLTLSELMQRCIVDKETGLTLFPIKQLAGGMVGLTSGKKVSIFRAIQEGLIDQQVMVRLLEAQLFAGGIVDPRTGHRLTVDEAVRHNLIDHDIACAILIRQIQMGGVIDPVSGQRLALDEAVQRDLMTSRSALVVLESLWSFQGLLWPESGEVLPMVNALQQGIVSTELAHRILKKRATVAALYIPETLEVISWGKSVQEGILDKNVADLLTSIQIPDAIPNLQEPGTSSMNRLSWNSACGRLTYSSLQFVNTNSSTETSDSGAMEERLLSHLMTHSYMNVHNGNRTLLVDAELNDMTKGLIEARENAAVMSREDLIRACNGKAYKTLMEINKSDTPAGIEEKIYHSTNIPDVKNCHVLDVNMVEPILVDVKDGIKQENSNWTLKGKGERLPCVEQTTEGTVTEVSSTDQILVLSSVLNDDYLDEESALDILTAQLQTGGITDERTGEKLTLNNAMTKGILQSHTALKLMEKLGILSGFFDPQTCETLTVSEAVDEGLMDEELIQKVFNSEKVICGVIDQGQSSVLSVKDAVEIGLLDHETAARILEGQVVSGGIIDLKRGKRLSVTLASKMGLVEDRHLDNLTKLEKATKGKESDESTKLKMMMLQMEMNGIVDPQTKELLTVVEARERGVLDKETILKALKKQVVDGGIIDHSSGMRLSVTDAGEYGLIDQDIATELIEVERACQHKYVHPKMMQPVTLSEAASLGLVNSAFAAEIQALQALSGTFTEPTTGKKLTLTQASKQGMLEKSVLEKAMSSPELNQGIVDPERCAIIPYSELIKKGKIDLDSGQRYMETTYFTGIKDELTGETLSVAEAVKAAKVDPVPALRLLQAQADSGGILDNTIGDRVTLAQAEECQLLEDNMIKIIVTNQILGGGVINTVTGERVAISDAAQSGLISSKMAEEIQSSLGFTPSDELYLSMDQVEESKSEEKGRPILEEVKGQPEEIQEMVKQEIGIEVASIEKMPVSQDNKEPPARKAKEKVTENVDESLAGVKGPFVDILTNVGEDIELNDETKELGGIDKMAGEATAIKNKVSGVRTAEIPAKPAKEGHKKLLNMQINVNSNIFHLSTSLPVLKDQLILAEVSALFELKELSNPINHELEAVVQVLEGSTQNVPQQLLKALEKDSKNLQKSFTSVCEVSRAWNAALTNALDTEKVINTECEQLQKTLERLVDWVTQTAQSVHQMESETSKEGIILKRYQQQYEELKEPLSLTKSDMDAAAFDVQYFISEHAQDLTPQQSRQLLRMLNELQKSFREISETILEDVLVSVQALQEQQEKCGQKLEREILWLTESLNTLSSCEQKVNMMGSVNDMTALLQLTSDIQVGDQNLQGSVSRAGAVEELIAAQEQFLEANRDKLDPKEAAELESKLLSAKGQHQLLCKRAENLQKHMDTSLTAATQQQTEKVRNRTETVSTTCPCVQDDLLPIHDLTVLCSELQESLNGKQCFVVETDALGNGLNQVQDHADGMTTMARHEELLSQQQAFILATQSAQSFLDKHSHNLSHEEKERLQRNLNELKARYETSLAQSEAQLKQIQSLQDEFQKFLKDHGEFEAWLVQSEQDLEEMKIGQMDTNSLQRTLQRQKSFSDDVISHKGDLRYITISGQKVLDTARSFTETSTNEDFKSAVDPSITSTLVKCKLNDAKNRYNTLHSKCNKLGTHLTNMLEKYQHFQEVANGLTSWLQRSETTAGKLVSETISSDSQSLQKQLENIKVLQGDLTEHQDSVTKLQKAAEVLFIYHCFVFLSESVSQRYDALSKIVSERNEKVQISVAQSQSVQQGLDNLLEWLENVERSSKTKDSISASSTAIQDALTQNSKLKQDIAGHQSSINTIQKMVSGFIKTADKATASSLQKKLDELNSRLGTVCSNQQQNEGKLANLLPKVEQYEKLLEEVGQFVGSKSQSLAAGGDPSKDIAHFTQEIQDVSREMVKQSGALQTLEQLAEELTASSLLTHKEQLTEAVRDLAGGYKKLEESVKEREVEALSCQQRLSEFRSLVVLMKKWLKEAESKVPAFESTLNSDTLEKQIQQIKNLLEDWSSKSSQVQDISHQGTELENLIMEITSPNSALISKLSEIQCSVSDVNSGYESLGNVLRERRDHLGSTLDQMQQVQEETNSIMKWLEVKEQTLSTLNSSPAKPQSVKAQAEQNKALLDELDQHCSKVEKLKQALTNLIKKNPESPEAEKCRKMLQEMAEKQQKLEESANLLTSFQSTESQLSPWLTEKELMMSVLGPLSIDPNMLHAQKQQVQFMLKEFETRKPQYEQLNQAAHGILNGPEDVSPLDDQVRDQQRAITEKWDKLTSQLGGRSHQIDQAIVKSVQYQNVLQILTDKVKSLQDKLNSQPLISTQPDIVKQQLEDTSEIRSDLEQQKEQIEEAQSLCSDLSCLIGEQYLKDELRKRLDNVLLPFKSLEESAGDRMNQLQTTLASSQQFQQTFDELKSWLDGKGSEQAQKPPVSAKLDILQSQIREQEEFQKNLNQHTGSYEMIIAEGESLFLNAQPGEEKSTLQSQLVSLKAQWDELNNQATGRHSKLKDCLQKAQKYRKHIGDLLPWIEECEAKIKELEISIDPVELNSSLAKAKHLNHDVDKRHSLLEMVNQAADSLVDSCQVDEEGIRDEKADINQRMDLITEQLQAKNESIEEMAQRLKEFQDSLLNIQKKLDGAKQQLEVYDALGTQAHSNKNLEKLRVQQETLQTLEPQVDYLRDLTRGLVEDTPAGADSSQLLQQAEAVQQEYATVKQRVGESCQSMENRLQGIGQFQSHIREMYSQLADLDDELDSMSPIGRDLDSLQSQFDDVKQFMSKLKELKGDIESSQKECTHMLEEEGSPDLQGLKRELGTLNKQCGKLLERGKNRQEHVETTMDRVDDFYGRLKDLGSLLTKAEEGEELQGVVGTEVDVINQQLADFKTFQKIQVDPIQSKLQQANGMGQGLIQSATKNANTQGLEHDLDETNIRWNTLNKKVAERTSQLQEALLHRGKFQDALEPLLSWLTDTEDLIANQKPPSAEYKVVKAQIQEQKLLQRLLDDRRATVQIIKAEGERIAESAEVAEKEKIQNQLQRLGKRWDALLSKAAARQNQLEDILVIAKQFHETVEPLNEWLTSRDKKLANSEPVGTQTAKIQQQITRHKALEDDITNHKENVQRAVKVGQVLLPLSSKPDQEMVEDKLESVQAQYREIRDRCSRKAALLQQALANAKIFGEEEVEVLNWLADIQDKLSLVTIKDYMCDILHKQHKEQLALNDDIISRKKNVDQAIKNGQALLKQTTGEEVIIIQEKLDGIKTRYAEITSASSRVLKTLEQVLQLATKFQSFNEELCTWLDSVEGELAANSPQSPVGEQIPQVHQRQKELKKEVMEYRLILDTVNEVSNALLELVPWRAREGLDRQVADANERYKTVSDTVTRRVEAIDAAIQRSQQYEQATDSELTWVAETKRKLTALGPIRLEQDQTTAQLQVQKAFSIDIIRHKDSIDELINTQEEILSTCGDEQKTMLQDKMGSLLQQYEAVSQMNTERYSQLERAQVLINQFWETYEELCPWIDETRALMSQLPPPAVDHEILKQQQEEMRQLRESISEHKPHIDKLMKIGPQLKALNPDEGKMVEEKYTTSEALYAQIKQDARQRALMLDEAISRSAQFHDKIDPMLESLEHISDRLRSPPSIPAEVDKIREHINENKNIGMELEKLQPSFDALKCCGEELIGRSTGADKDPAAKAIQDKLNQMVFFWDDIKAHAEERDIKLLDVLDLAEKFWYDMAALLTTIKDTQDIVRDLENPGIDPSIIKQQQEAAETIKEETDGLHEELEFVRILGADLIFACGELEKPEVKKSIDELNSSWDNLNKTWKERLGKLEEAMQAGVQYQDALQAMFDWLDNTVIKLSEMSPIGTDLNTVKQQINEMKQFKMEVYQQQIEMEKLNHQGELLLKKASDDTDRDVVREPLTELKHLWDDLGEKIVHRQHKLEGALLALGQFQHALAELMSWLNYTEDLLDGQRPISGDPKAIEIELAKHHVLKNDVLAHTSTVETVNKAGNELLESSEGEDANNLKSRLDKLNQSWQSVLHKTEGREQQLEAALQQAEGFHSEIEEFLQWLSRIENQLAASKSTGGLPETAREQLNAHLDLYSEFCANEETYRKLHEKGQLLLYSRDDTAGSNAEQCVTLLAQKWQAIGVKMVERKTKLEEALNLATEFQNSLQDFINWLTQAEQGLNVAAPPSLILDTVLFQIDEHKIFANEVNLHRDQIIDLDKTGNQLKFLSQKQDVVLIKNLLFSVQSRWEKVVQRSVERGRGLDDARKRAKQFYEAWKKLIDWLEEAENNLDSDLEISNDPDKIKLQLVKHKEFQKTLGGKQPVYDTTIRMGRSMKDKASLQDDRQKLDNLLGEVRDKWDTVCGKSVERQHKLEEALLFSGQFTDALQALVDWLYKVEPQLAEDQPVHGDLDLVMNLLDAHKVFQKELGKRTSSVQVLKRSARELIENSRDDTTWVKVQLQELSTRWDTVCKLSVSKQTRLEQALKQAEEFRNAVHALLEWLSEAEQTLRFRGVLPDDVEALQSLIDLHKDFMKKVEEKRVDVNQAAEMGEAILAVCHPDCVTTVKHWITIIRARFEEVLTWAKQHHQRLATALSELVTNAELLDELLTWLQWAETTLIQRDQDPMAKDIEQVKTLIAEHQSFMEEMTRKQPDVDKVTKTYKRKAVEPSHMRGRKPLHQLANPPSPVTVPSQTEAKNPRINLLSGRWQQVWLLALERQRKLHDCLDRLEELKEFANFDFDVWRKKYMRWMNHKKSRVMDFFRRIDKDQDGKITRQEFIDGILSSKFPTSKLEMTAVADIFDRDGDGYIDYYEFVAALHPNKDAYRPVTDADKIEDEVTRQVAQCKCAKRFQVEQIGENKYRSRLFCLQFGDSQQLRLVRILRSTVMVRVGGGWMALDEFLVKNDPCRARGRTNLELREKFILPEGASQGMAAFRTRGRRSKPSSRAASPTRSSSSASHSNHSCTSMPTSPATPASGSRVSQLCGSKLRRPSYHSSKVSLTGDNEHASTPTNPKRTPSRPNSRAGSRAGSRASSRRGSDASDFDLLETQSMCSDISESSTPGSHAASRRGSTKPSKIPTPSKKTTATKNTSTRR
uniref:Microtubule actin crosslinking factor 1 n=1 Tax=Callorhinchus milii TaxID=7868 RepID=A0A4W3HHW7_CALMI